MSHEVAHLDSGKRFMRPKLLVNTLQQRRNWSQTTDPAIETFHKALPNYAETQLHSLPDIAAELGFSHVFVKDESTRFGLPAFKILGASWAIHQSICKRLALPKATSLAELIEVLKGRDDVRLVLCTEGNWGRACARMAKYLGIACKIYVPHLMDIFTRDLLMGEGAEVVVLENGSYDDCIAAWVTDGYSTMLAETTRQIASQTGSHDPSILAFVSVGVGSWAQSVVSYYKSASAEANTIISVEPTAAPSFKESLHCSTITSIRTGETTMSGMNCGTTSLIAWPEMRDGVSAAVTVEDREAHRDVEALRAKGVDAGPCGAATLAALRAICEAADRGEMNELGLPRKERKGRVAVLFSTEGGREYEVPE